MRPKSEGTGETQERDSDFAPFAGIYREMRGFLRKTEKPSEIVQNPLK